jgi:hypothetical protein
MCQYAASGKTGDVSLSQSWTKTIHADDVGGSTQLFHIAGHT